MKKLVALYRSIYLPLRFHVALGVVFGMFVLSFPFTFLFPIAKSLLVFLIIATLVDGLLLFTRQLKFQIKRIVPSIFNLGDEATIKIKIRNHFSRGLSIRLIDEVPVQFQERNFLISFFLKANQLKELEYALTPLVRGEYCFGNLNLLVKSKIGLVERKIVEEQEHVVACYPSIIQMKNLELMAFAKISNFEGIKKIRRLGHSYEFEQIKSYVQGDDIRVVNWKATGRRNALMVNQYEDEKAQQVYSIIDKSRAMKMPFNGLSLLDHSVNACLAISNIVLKKDDKAGLISFSNKIGTTLRADKSRLQLKKILNYLYNEKERVDYEANYDLLYRAVKNVVKGRSLLFLYINFESKYAMERALPILKKINHLHLLVVIIFENTEMVEYSKKKVKKVSDIYTQTIAQKFIGQKREMAKELNKHKIQTILTKPEELSLNTVNKYLELKSRGLI